MTRYALLYIEAGFGARRTRIYSALRWSSAVGNHIWVKFWEDPEHLISVRDYPGNRHLQPRIIRITDIPCPTA